ncbi:MAG: hypothetical protein E6F99_29085 [Actinobacteria bacterium]|nr:MAG: hypothetical protein E6F99_29085 [Actinomycetota bacterium]
MDRADPVRENPGEPDIDVWVAENDARGRRLEGNVLGPRSAATTVRVRDGELLICDGPFAETKEVIVGYDLIEVADLDEAIEGAHRCGRRDRHTTSSVPSAHRRRRTNCRPCYSRRISPHRSALLNPRVRYSGELSS